jgi:truncated hemoglobin YjbI
MNDAPAQVELTREQAEAFIETLWPCGHMAHLDNPTRTFFAALMGAKRVPQGILPNDAAREDQRVLAGILRQIAAHLDNSEPSP